MHHNSHRSAFAIQTYSCNFIFGIIGHTCLGWGFVPSQTPCVLTILLALNVSKLSLIILIFSCVSINFDVFYEISLKFFVLLIFILIFAHTYKQRWEILWQN